MLNRKTKKVGLVLSVLVVYVSIGYIGLGVETAPQPYPREDFSKETAYPVATLIRQQYRESVYLRFDGNRTDKYGRLLASACACLRVRTGRRTRRQVSVPRSGWAIRQLRDCQAGLRACVHTVPVQASRTVPPLRTASAGSGKGAFWQCVSQCGGVPPIGTPSQARDN
jgi:hypothetical protein